MTVALGSWICLLALLVLAPPARAQMYQWEDDHGTLHYTNDLHSIPEPYRGRARFVPTSPMAPPAAATPAGITRIPFTPGAPILVSARINGAGPITLILDTGADRTLVAPEALWRLGISTAGAPTAEIKGVTGTARAGVLPIASLEVGEARAGPFLILTHDPDLKIAEGLLGRDFLERFTVTIDAANRLVTLAPK